MEALDWSAPVWLLEAGLLVALVAVVGEGVARRRSLLRPRSTAGLALLLVAAIVPRWIAPWATYDPEFRATAMFWEESQFTRYGFGMPAIERLLRDVLHLPVGWSTIFWAGFLSGVLTVPLLGAWLRDAGWSRTGAVAAGLVLALDPAHVRLSPTELPNPHEILLTTLALVLATRHARAPSTVVGIAAGVVLGTAVNLRPEGLVMAPIVVGLAGLVGGRPPLRHRGTWGGLLALAVFAAPQVGLVIAHALTDAGRYTGGFVADGRLNHAVVKYGWRHAYGLDPAWSPPLVGLSAAVGLLCARRRGLLVATAVVALGLTLLVPGESWSPAGGTWFAYVRHQLRVAPWWGVLAGGGVEALRQRVGPAAGAVGLLALAGSRLAWLPVAYVPSTIQAEFAFLVGHLDAVPRGCTLVTAAARGDGPLWVPGYVETMRPDLRVLRTGDHPIPAEGCLVWYRASACVASELPPQEPPLPQRCAAFEAAHVLRPIAETVLPAATWIGEVYEAERIPVGFYRATAR